MTSSNAPLILASASPRRAEILTTLGLAFEVEPSHADETALTVEDDAEFVRDAAMLKLERVASRRTSDAFVLAADTVVCAEGARLGKPVDDREALSMLERLSGRSHEVLTGLALRRVGNESSHATVVRTRVWFRDASPEELRGYVASGEGRDKAGAYGIQGLASGFVTRIEGSYTNVVGLPAAETILLLREGGALGSWP